MDFFRIFRPLTTPHKPNLPRFAGAQRTLVRYTPQKNKQRLQMKKVRRKRMNPPGTKKEKETNKNETLLGGADGSIAALAPS